MKTKILLIVALLAFGVNAIPSYSPYKIYQQTDTLTHANLDSNLLRGSDWSVKLVDTLEKKFIRFLDVKDSTFQKINADTVIADTIHITGNAKIDGVLNATADSASGSLRLGGKTKAYYDTVGRGYNVARANHTGAQAVSTVTGLQAALDGKASYDTGSFNFTIRNTSPAVLVPVKWTKIGRQVTMSLGAASATMSYTTDYFELLGVPTALIPTIEKMIGVPNKTVGTSGGTTFSDVSALIGSIDNSEAETDVLSILRGANWDPSSARQITRSFDITYILE